MMEIIEEGARVLCEYTEAVASRLHLLAPKVVLIGGLFHRDSIYTHAYRRRLKKNLPDARVATAERAPELGAAWLATEAGDHAAFQPSAISKRNRQFGGGAYRAAQSALGEPGENERARIGRSFCRGRKVRSRSVARRDRRALDQAIEIVAESLRNGGRLFYVGAGSSGRIGVLDASEIPPTFGAPRDLVQGVIAGGATALYRSVEGAEDEESAGALALDERRIKGRDVVIGITASGRTPFVLGALARAKVVRRKNDFAHLQSNCSRRR